MVALLVEVRRSGFIDKVVKALFECYFCEGTYQFYLSYFQEFARTVGTLTRLKRLMFK